MNSAAIYSGRKLYLSGIDWFVRAMDCRTRAFTGAGNASQIVVVLQGRPDSRELRRRVDACLAEYPLLTGRCRRNRLNLAPYWEIPRSAGNFCPLDIRPDTQITSPLPPPELAIEVNRPFQDKPRIALTLMPGSVRSYLAMRFDHQILDAAGAEMLLRHIGGNVSSQPLSPGERNAHLNNWMDKFKAGQIVNRELLALRAKTPPVALTMPTRTRRETIRSLFAFRAFSQSQTDTILANAEKHVGYLMLLPFLLGAGVNAFHRLCRNRQTGGNHYVVPVTMNARRPAESHIAFFNHLSFNFYRFEAETAADAGMCRRQAAAQMYRQAADRIADRVEQAGYPMRILPAAWLGKLMGLPLDGTLGSFSFALVGGKEFDADLFMDVPVENVYHMPRVPTPPGTGIYFNRYRRRLNLSLSYLEGMLERTEAERLADGIVENLLMDAEA